MQKGCAIERRVSNQRDKNFTQDKNKYFPQKMWPSHYTVSIKSNE